MNIILEKTTYRSEGRTLNMADDMVRLTIDMKRTDWPMLRKLLQDHGVVLNSNSTTTNAD